MRKYEDDPVWLALCAAVIANPDDDLLCKLVGFNLTVLIHEQEESGITPEFFPGGEDNAPATLRFPRVGG